MPGLRKAASRFFLPLRKFCAYLTKIADKSLKQNVIQLHLSILAWFNLKNEGFLDGLAVLSTLKIQPDDFVETLHFLRTTSRLKP